MRAVQRHGSTRAFAAIAQWPSSAPVFLESGWRRVVASSAATLSASRRLSACFAPSCKQPACQVVATSFHSKLRRAFRPVLVAACSSWMHSLHSTLVIAARGAQHRLAARHQTRAAPPAATGLCTATVRRFSTRQSADDVVRSGPRCRSALSGDVRRSRGAVPLAGCAPPPHDAATQRLLLPACGRAYLAR